MLEILAKEEPLLREAKKIIEAARACPALGHFGSEFGGGGGENRCWCSQMSVFGACWELCHGA